MAWLVRSVVASLRIPQGNSSGLFLRTLTGAARSAGLETMAAEPEEPGAVAKKIPITVDIISDPN